jgi:hypothetical protein
MAMYDFTAYAILTLVDGEIVKKKIRNSIMARNLEYAHRDAPGYVADIINDFGSDDIDAPLDSYEIKFITFDDDAWKED